MTERLFKDAAALEAATDHVIRDLTQVHVSEDAVRRVMARVRAAGAGDATETRSRSESGWFGALLAPRVSWGMMASTAALTAFVAAGLTLLVVRDIGRDSSEPPNPKAPVATVARHAPITNRAAAPGESVGPAMVMTPDEDPPKGTTATAAAPAAQAAGAAAAVAPQDVRLDVTITDQSGAARPITKNVSLIVADRADGSIRSETRVPFARKNGPVTAWDWETLPLNVTVWPTIMGDGHVRVKLSLNYRTAGAGAESNDAPRSTAVITKELTAVLSDGKPLVISTSADAATDRKVMVEVKATIQK
jgi:hypothetical protein